MKIPKLVKNSSIYMVVMVLQKGIGFFMLPLYTAYLTPKDYGIQAVVTSVASFLSVFITLGLDAAAQRFFYKYKSGEEYVKKLYGTVSVAILLNSIIVGTIFILGHKWLIEPFVGDIAFYPFVLLGILYVIVNPIYLLYQNYLNTKQDGLAYGLNSIVNTFLYIGLVVLFLVKFNMGVLGVLLAHLIVAVVFFIYLAVCFLRKLYLKWNSHTMKEAFKYSLPLLPHTLANWSNGTMDKLLVNDIRSTADTGIYGLGQQYAGVMSITANAINQAYVPWFYQKVDSNELHLVRHSANALFAVICVIAVILTFFSKELLSLMISNPAYNEVYTIIPYLIFAFVFQFIYFFFVNVLFLRDTGVIFVITALTVIFNVVLNLVFIPRFGIIGAAVACTITYFLKSVFALIVSSYKNKVIRFNWAYMYLLAFCTFFMAIGLDWFSNHLHLGYMLLVKIGILAILSGALFFVFKEDIKLIIVQFRKK
jgi:O-antigen/teichoic acid export membrane protein